MLALPPRRRAARRLLRHRRAPLSSGLTAAVLTFGLWLTPAGAGTGGYHHLGAASDIGWTGVVGRLQVRDPEVRAGTYDFVAARFMVKQHRDRQRQLRDADGELRPWRGEVATASADDHGRYCVDWQQPYDTWSAGDC